MIQFNRSSAFSDRATVHQTTDVPYEASPGPYDDYFVAWMFVSRSASVAPNIRRWCRLCRSLVNFPHDCPGDGAPSEDAA